MRRFRAKGLTYSVPVPRASALRWARSAELFVFVLWDVVRDRGLWTSSLEFPLEQEWQLSHRQSVGIKIRRTSPFNETQALKLGWLARIRHWDHLLAQALIFGVPNDEGKEVDEPAFDSTANWIGLDFLSQIDVLEKLPRGRLRLSRWFIRECARSSRRDRALEPELVATLVAMRRLNDLAGVAVGEPHRLMIAVIEAMSTFTNLYSAKLQKLKMSFQSKAGKRPTRKPDH